MNNNVIAVVVTFNRKKLLMECIEAIFRQTYSISQLIIIDNCSTDGTADELKAKGYMAHSKVTYVKTESNSGGAGGFYEGMITSLNFQYDWLWIMDDDTIPSNECLEKLIESSKQINTDISFLASAIYGTNGEFMNVPTINTKESDNGYQYWYRYLGNGIISINTATFVSIMISRKAIEKCGLPCKDFFIWGDDTEYTTRLTQYYGEAYMVGNSIAIHKRATPRKLSIEFEDNPNRIDMFHYYYRNSVIIKRFYDSAFRAFVMFTFQILTSFRFLFKHNGFRKMKAIIKGSLESIMQYKKFKKFIISQVQY